jgi:hypothetical protein
MLGSGRIPVRDKETDRNNSVKFTIKLGVEITRQKATEAPQSAEFHPQGDVYAVTERSYSEQQEELLEKRERRDWENSIGFQPNPNK